MRCIRNQTIAIVAVFVGIYFVFPLLLNNRPTVTYVRSGNARVKNNLKSKTLPVWKAVERFENASVQVDGSKTKLVSNLAMKHKKLEKLEVFIVLHSHVDPGWLETFDDYYAHKVDSILNLAVSQLTEHSDLRFIWSEVSFLERWWQTANETQRKRAKKLVAEGRFEICGGSWVMTDEATPYFWASIDDLVEGQRFLTEIFNVTPTTSWSVDPFGHGTMLPFMLPLTGIENLVIGRINNELKGMIRQQSLLNLNWKQSWANVKNGQSKPPLSAYVNILPNKFYTTWDACGPDPGVCCTFDLGPSARYPCSQKANDINAQNVKSYADMLAGQYRKLSKFYRVPSLLVPIGDDFFFSVIEDWTEVYNNYKMVIDYVNKEPSYNMKLRFATPGEFFASIPKKSKASAPSLSGDFFPYLDDRNNGFPAWTAYFAHLPYYKRMGRIVEAKLRSLDLLRIAAAPGSKGLEKLLIDSRRNLALFQHHDGITGTSKKHTMADFLQRLFYAYGNITEVENRLFKAKSKTPFEPLETLSNEANRFLTKKLFSKKKNPVSEIAIFNPLTIRNTRRVVVHSDSPKVKLILGADSKEIQAQVLPHIVDGAVSESVFEILFFVDLEPLAKTEVLLEFVDSQPSSTIISKVHSSAKKPNAAFKELKPGAAFVLKNDLIKAKVMDGKITDIDLQSGKSLDFKFELAKYSDRGGAYVFVPGTRTELPKLKHYFYVSGPLCNQVVSTAESVNITHWISVFLSKDPILDSSLDIEVFSDITKTIGETFMFVMGSGAIENEQTFYTDANGLHMMRRHYNKDESLEMNFYPSPSTSFLGP
ncbi:hypothetical protein L596_030629 [Steinernema carpocapsae]|uniref:Glycoside hydrolase family 38 central domain-containing protein n=1 Tax=Steinernema carpocapsae TaxID=34508 RepID=A0A4U5LQ05_STECR|nr:hypothetical protein L596_030629 [Steinernema carpocapsae]